MWSWPLTDDAAALLIWVQLLTDFVILGWGFALFLAWVSERRDNRRKGV